MRITIHYILFFLWLSALISCSHSKKFTKDYYRDHEAGFRSVYRQYNDIYSKTPFSLQIIDKNFNFISLEILTNDIRYIYEFNLSEDKLDDTLQKYHFNVKAMHGLMDTMNKLQCTWITKLDYYENRQAKYLVFISVRHKNLEAFLKKTKYFTLAIFEQPQPSDKKGRLKDKTDDKHLRKINDAVFRKINERVFYAFSLRFR